MALSNIFNEPRREITETVIGLAVIGVVVLADYKFATWLADLSDGPDRGLKVFLGLVLGIVSVAVFTGLLILIHAAGEEVCDAFSRVGRDPRPTNRYRR